MTKEILTFMEERRMKKDQNEEYDKLTKIQLACDAAKERWLEEQCTEVETNYLFKNTKAMH